MMDCVSVYNMRLSDRQTIESGISGRELIQRAAFGVYQAVEWSGRIAIVTGSGNNGADGYALASILHSNNIDVTVFNISERMHDDCAYFAIQAMKNGVCMQSYQTGNNVLHRYDMIVDCMLGTGFRGELREAYRCVIAEINASDAYVVSVDINSGMNGDSGEGSAIVHSNLTVAIEFIKNGMIFESAEKYIDKLICVKIGIELAEKENLICGEQEWASICEEHQVSSERTVVEINGTRYLKCPKWLEMN